MKKVLFLSIFCIILCSCTKRYKYVEKYVTQEILLSDNYKELEKDPQDIIASNDSIAYVNAYKKFCTSKKKATNSRKNGVKDIEMPISFMLYNGDGVIVKPNIPQQVLNDIRYNILGAENIKDKTKLIKNKYKVLDLVDSISVLYPKKYKNDIQSKEFCEMLFMEINTKLEKDNSYLAEIPVQFTQMLQKGKNYIVKFECGDYTTNDKGLYSQKGNYSINYAIFAEVPKSFASELEDNKIYHITGKYVGSVNGKLVLPSGRLFNYNTSCYSVEGKGTICLGGFLFKNLNIK